ncbi:hypothetical protein TNCV_488571 [Trichonephila clavipes]|nr:hypothetical protein TNCV_488571 [Trichonephila clavipes]
MATGSSLTQNHSRSQSEMQGDLHTMWFHMHLFSLCTKLKSLYTKRFLFWNEQNTENISHAGSSLEEFVAVDDDNVKLQLWLKDIMKFAQNLKISVMQIPTMKMK